MNQPDTPVWLYSTGATVPVGTMYCIGRNYSEHAAEMGAVVPTSPLVFIKPPAAYRQDMSNIDLPSWTSNVHHEVELVAVIGKDGGIDGYAVGLDLTARDIQTEAKKKGEPWAVSKAWSGSAPTSVIVPSDVIGDRERDLVISLKVNGSLRQQTGIYAMERDVRTLVSYIQSVFSLRQGDCIFTGTPAGVAQIHAGDLLEATLTLDDKILTTLTITISGDAA